MLQICNPYYNHICNRYDAFKVDKNVYTRVEDYPDGNVMLPNYYYGIGSFSLLDGETLEAFGYQK